VVGFFTVVLAVGIAFMVVGLITLSDWRCLGTRFFRWSVKIPWMRYWEGLGYQQWRFTMGGVALLSGVVFSIAAIVNLA